MPDAGAGAMFSFLPPEWLVAIDSTSSEIKRRYLEGGDGPNGLVVAAERQTAGRGRMGRSWVSQPGAGLFFSFLLRPDGLTLQQLGTLPMACALGVADFLAARGVECQCKWPNDVLAGAGKICGILSETVANSAGRVLVVGMGVNLNPDPRVGQAIEQAAVALGDFTEERYDPREVLPDVLNALAARIRVWLAEGFDGIRRDFVARLWGMEQPVRVRTPKGTEEGQIAGLGSDGELLLRRADGTSVAVHSVAALEPV